MPTFNNGESAASVRTKINEAIDKVDGASPITSADINGGTIDGTVIGGSTPAAISGTTLSASTSLTTPLVTNAGNIALSATGANVVTASTNNAERLRIDSSGNVGIGAAATAGNVNANSTRVTIAGSNAGTFGGEFIAAGAASTISIASGSTVSYVWNNENFPMVFATNATERMRIDASGNLLVGKTAFGIAAQGFQTAAAGQSAFTADAGQVALYINHVSPSGTQTAVEFRYGASTTVGNITLTSTATTYATSSDYRLKEDVQPMVGASDRLMALKPVNFAWKVNGSRVDGFIAHEAQEVVPEAVTGEKDGEEMQAIDHSKLVPLLTAALQEALTKIEALEARLNALEGQ
jgi:hypothetical protein